MSICWLVYQESRVYSLQLHILYRQLIRSFGPCCSHLPSPPDEQPDPQFATPDALSSAAEAYCMFHGAWFSAQWGELTWGSLDQRGITEGEFASMPLGNRIARAANDKNAKRGLTYPAQPLWGIGCLTEQEKVEKDGKRILKV